MIKKLTLISLLFIIAILFAKPINLVTADLGRHIKNGEIILKYKDSRIFSTNYYSYTNAGFETINHHWGTGIIFYIVRELSGFKGLSLFYIFISTLSIFVFMLGANLILKQNNTKGGLKKLKISNKTMLATVLAIPFLTMRTEIRPEGLSYLFLALFFYILMRFKNEKRQTKISQTNYGMVKIVKSYKYLVLLPILQLLWVNIHIFFIFGPFLIAVFLIQEILEQKTVRKFSEKTKVLTTILLLSSATLLINPLFLKGALVPLTIFKEYGYMLVENQSVFFMQKRFPQPLYIYAEVLTIVIIQIVAFLTFTKFGGTKKPLAKLKNNFYILVPLLTFMIMGFKSNRLLVLFGYFSIAFLVHFFSKLKVKVSLSYVLVALIFVIPFTKKAFANTSIGLITNNLSSVEFFKENKIKGPIFNNYDIGGYLVYGLFPNEKVFVDNRPESYPQKFLQDEYVLMQENEDVWNAQLEKYDFNTIYFYRRDATPWAQPFLIRRLEDASWVPVFVDDYVIILVRNSDMNREVIDRFELPEGMFVVSK